MKYPSNNIIYGNRGMTLEYLINSSNDYYRMIDKAIVYKKPTPITVARVNFPSRYEAKIEEAYYKTPSTTDYNGIYNKKYIDYEAKETIKDYFPLAHIFEHQINHLLKVKSLGGISFVIIYFKNYNSIILIDIIDFINFFNKNNTKTLKYNDAIKIGHIVNIDNNIINYLKIIDYLYL